MKGVHVHEPPEGAIRPEAEEECGAIIGEEGDVVLSDDDEPEAGVRKTLKMIDPQRPREEDVEEHQLTHLPFRNWCRHCICGRGREMPHRKAEAETGMTEMYLDFAFMGDAENPGRTVPMLVVRERSTKMTMAAAVPSKSTGTYIARRVVAFFKEVGCESGDMIVKSDQEAAIVSIVRAAGRVRAATGTGKYITENSPVHSSGSNGIVERAILSVEQQVRVLKNALESRWKVKLPAAHRIIPWMIEYAAVLLNRFEVGRDGRTSYERMKGKQAKTMGMEFGEAILWKRKPSGGALGKLTCMWQDGFLRVLGRGPGKLSCRTRRGFGRPGQCRGNRSRRGGSRSRLR